MHGGACEDSLGDVAVQIQIGSHVVRTDEEHILPQREGEADKTKQEARNVSRHHLNPSCFVLTALYLLLELESKIKPWAHSGVTVCISFLLNRIIIFFTSFAKF